MTEITRPRPGDDEGDRRRDERSAPRFVAPPSRCPYCHDGCAEDDAVAVCRQCLAKHHAECWSASGACAACTGERVLVERPTSASAARVYALSVEREPAWLRRPVGWFMLLMTAVCASLGLFMIMNIFRNVNDPGEVVLAVLLGVGLLAVFPAWVCWRAARARLFPVAPGGATARGEPLKHGRAGPRDSQGAQPGRDGAGP